MKKQTWHVSGVVSGTKYIGEFQAKTGDEAMELANERAGVSFCHQCTRHCQDPEILFMTATTDDGEVVTTERTWEDMARAAGWTPPPSKPKRSAARKKSTGA